MLTPVPDLIYGALAEIRVARGGDVVRAEDQALCLMFLNEVLERLAVTPHALYSTTTAIVPLTPGVRAYLIGPTGVAVLPRRPVRLVGAWFNHGATNTLIPVQSLHWSDAHALPGQPGARPEGVVYNPLWPNGEMAFYPVPATADIVGCRVEVEILAVAVTDTIDLPQGYSELLRLWTAKKAAPSFAREFSSASQAALTECLSEIFGTNIPPVNDLDTRDGGVPGGGGGTYDYRTGLVS